MAWRAAMVAAWMLGACSSTGEGGPASPPRADGGGDDDGVPVPGVDGGAAKDGGRVQDSGTPQDGGGNPAKGPLWAFVGSADGKVRAYLVDEATGAFALKSTTSAGQNPSYLAIDVAKRHLVAVDEANQGLVRSFTFETSSLSLTEVSSKSSGGAGPAHLSLDATGAWVFVANYTGGTTSVFPLGADGKLGESADNKTSGNKSHWAGTNPSGSHVFVPALGAGNVAQYTFNAQTGKLTANGTASLPAGAGPRHLAFHPNEAYAYVINETAISVTAFAFDKASGKLTANQTLSALPAGQATQGVSGAAIFVHPNGKHVYASTRGYNSIAQFNVNPGDGQLTYVSNTQTGGPRPRSFALSPDGAWLFAANQDDGAIVSFRIDANTGTLSPAGEATQVPSPAFVGLVRGDAP